MRLHTRDQAPKEGEREAAEQAWKQVGLALSVFEPHQPGLSTNLFTASALHHCLCCHDNAKQ